MICIQLIVVSVLKFIQILLRAEGEDISELKIAALYVLELAKCDMNYDVRDRARVIKNLLSHCQTKFKDLTCVLADYIFGGQAEVSSEPFSYRFYLPGSLSQIVLHAAPGYEPLPEPRSFVDDGTAHFPSHAQGSNADSEMNEDDSDAVSGSMDEENMSNYSSECSVSDSSDDGGSDNSATGGNEDEEGDALIHLSDGATTPKNHFEGSEDQISSGLKDFGELMSKRALESWLNENPGSSQNSSGQGHVQKPMARISMKDIGQLVKPKSYTLLDPANGNGLGVNYRFLSEVSLISPELVCLEVTFRNYSTESISKIQLSEEESDQHVDPSDKSVSSSER